MGSGASSSPRSRGRAQRPGRARLEVATAERVSTSVAQTLLEGPEAGEQQPGCLLTPAATRSAMDWRQAAREQIDALLTAELADVESTRRPPS